VLLDIMMPGVGGVEVLKSVRRTRSASQLPIIMLTGKSASEHALEVLSYGANDYVEKPIAFPVLMTRIEAQVAGKRVEETMRGLNKDLELQIAERTKDLHKANEALITSERRYHALYDDTPAMFFTLDPKGTILSVNRFGEETLGLRAGEVLGRPASTLYVAEDRESFQDHLEACLREPDAVHHCELRMARKRGGDLWVRETGRAVTETGAPRHVVTVCEDITKAHALSEELSYQANHDLLTGLVSRRAFEQRLQRLLETAREDGTENALCYMDLDQFKVINDICGHVAGDEMLRQLGGVLGKQIKSGDTLARLGGDEFALVMEDCSIEEACRLCNTLREVIEEFKFLWDGKSFSLGVSIGVVAVNEASTNVTTLLSAADIACFAAKDDGRNRIHVYHEDDTELADRHGQMQWVSRINQALIEDRFRLDFQPIVPLSGEAGAGTHYELLVRMESETGGRVPPDAFLPAAELYNLSPRLDRWVINFALDWLERHPKHLDDLVLCGINISAPSLGSQDLLNYVLERFTNSKVPPAKICFELTETAAIKNMAYAIRFMKALKELGCRFALDDFGSGLSSFAYLKDMPVDFLKIDGMFVRDIVDDPIHLAMVKSINEIGQVMGKRTIAEFVENDEIFYKLKEIGVDYAQGYGIAAPKGIDQMA
jgi:diguanylate cyclase (GGDEF)-like protein/PAS domain S-box-containing protein